jgi:tripartite-type tricarboxylate transporter receptor subunit TctC
MRRHAKAPWGTAEKTRPTQRALVAAALLAQICAPGAAMADPVADFYRGRQVNLILSAGVGGGYASYANAFAPYFGDHIPGKPQVVIQNMPGAGGVRAMTYFYSVAPRDGTTVGFVHSSVPFAPLFGLPGAAFEPREMHWIGSLNGATAICVAWHGSRIKTAQDLFEKEFIVGSSGIGSQMETFPIMLHRLFGMKTKVVSGYKSGNDIYLAMERGEVDGRCAGLVSSINSTRPDWFPEKKVSVPIQVSLTRDPLFPDVPAVGEFAKDERTRRILQLLTAPQDMDRPLLVPPGVPAERVAALRKAFHEAMNDPGFIAEAKKQNLELKELDGEGVAKIVEDAYALSPDIVQATREAVKPLNSAGGP